MNRYCSKCRGSCSENVDFCPNCGMQLLQNHNIDTPTNNDYSGFEQPTDNNYNDFEQQVADTYEKPKPQQVVTPQYQTLEQSYSYQQKPSKTKPILAIVGAIAIVGMLIAVVLLVPFNFGNNDENVQIMTTGPKVSLQSLANGNTLVVPEVGFTGVYGYYISGTKTGEISFSSEGVELYDGEQCIKVVGSGYFGITLAEEEMTFKYNYDAYIANDDYSLKFFQMTTSYKGTNMYVTMDYDEVAGEITASYTYEGYDGADSTVVMKMSDEYWDLSDAFENLYIGYKKEFSYTVDSFGYETKISMVLSVTGKSDVIVPAGKFKDCYIVELGQGTDGVSSTSTMWVTKGGIVPKMEISSISSGIDAEIAIVLQLESYYEG